MNAWAKSLPVVSVPPANSLKPITLVYPYYENPCFLRRQLEHLAALHASLTIRDRLSIVVVDDGSPDSPAAMVMRAVARPNPTRLFAIEVDVPWNWLAARNIGLHHAADGWVLVTDIDHLVPVETLDSLIRGQHDPGVIYALSRQEHTGVLIPPHSASFFLTREMFWRVGGYDEALSGHYGSDGDWRRRCTKVAPIHVLTDRLIRYEHVDDSSTTRYARKLPADTAALARLVSERGPTWTPTTLSFPYHEVTL